MSTCSICRFETVLDDVAVGSVRGRCICLSCFGRATGNMRPLPKSLQHTLTTILATLEIS